MHCAKDHKKSETRPMIGPAGRHRQPFVLALLLICAFVGVRAAGDDYSTQWGPPLGSRIPVLEAYDQDGTLRTLDDLAGEHGLLLVFSRSADW